MIFCPPKMLCIFQPQLKAHLINFDVYKQPLQHFVENSVCPIIAVPGPDALTLTQRKCGLKVSLGDYHFKE